MDDNFSRLFANIKQMEPVAAITYTTNLIDDIQQTLQPELARLRRQAVVERRQELTGAGMPAVRAEMQIAEETGLSVSTVQRMFAEREKYSQQGE